MLKKDAPQRSMTERHEPLALPHDKTWISNEEYDTIYPNLDPAQDVERWMSEAEIHKTFRLHRNAVSNAATSDYVRHAIYRHGEWYVTRERAMEYFALLDQPEWWPPIYDVRKFRTIQTVAGLYEGLWCGIAPGTWAKCPPELRLIWESQTHMLRSAWVGDAYRVAYGDKSDGRISVEFFDLTPNGYMDLLNFITG